MNELRASIDIGSNSILLLVAEVTADGKIFEKEKLFEVTSLGKGLDKNKAFQEDKMEASFQALKHYAEVCSRFGVKPEQIIATATEAARVATNASDFFIKVERELGIKVYIITSNAEVYYSTKGVLGNTSFDSEFVTIMDIGGASTELMKVNTKDLSVIESISMPVGAVRCTDWLLENVFVQSLQKVFIDFRTELDKLQTKDLYCVAGTMTSLGNMHLERTEFIEDDVHGMQLKVEDVDQLFKKYSNLEPMAYLEKFPFLGKRSECIRGGLHLTYHLAHRLFVKNMTISTYGLRYGTLLEGKIKEEDIFKGA